MPKRANDVPRLLLLIVDDHAHTREMYGLYFRMCGYNVDTAKDGHVAVIKARRLCPDLIVMDLKMPRLDGFGAMRQLRATPRTAAIPVIVLTGHDFKAGLKYSAMAEGAVSYLMKPTSSEQLARQITVLLAARPAIRRQTTG
jgi:CheY-like chemotaxis protein